MPNLYPVFDMPGLVEQQQTEPAPKYGRSWAFDFDTGDFVRDNTGRIVQASGHSAWVHGCLKAVMTERHAHLAYNGDYGCEIGLIKQQPNREAVEAEIERVVTEALLADERTQVARNFTYAWQGDEVMVTFDVVPVIGTTEAVRVKFSL